MRVVCFWSFKGGVGRSLALANLASVLARLHKNVLCLDLDLEAPSLPHIFGIAPPRYGFVNYALDWLSGGPESVEPHVPHLVMPLGGDRAAAGQGQVSLVAAGGTATEESRDAYWDAIIGGQLGVLFPPPMFADPQWEPEFSPFENLYKGFWGAFLASLESLHPDLDFLLVDTRPGLSPLSTASLGIFRGAPDLLVSEGTSAEALWNISPWIADLVLFADPSSPPTLPGIREFLKRLSSDTEITKSRRVTLITRVPGSLEVSTDSKFDAKEWLGEVSEKVDAFERLASDPFLEKDGRMLIPLSGPVDYRPPLNSYLRMCLATFDVSTKIPAGDRIRDRLIAFRGVLGVDEARPNDYKLFELPAGGRMFNIRDEQPNISLRVVTLHALLDSLWEDVERRGLTEGLAPGLRQAGRSAGSRFGRAHLADRQSVETSERETIEEWCDFDSRVGWGLLEPVITVEDDQLRGMKVYNNSFAVAPSEQGEETHNFCDFLSGYFEGVLSELLRREITVGPHPPEECIRGGDRDVCMFTVETL